MSDLLVKQPDGEWQRLGQVTGLTLNLNNVTEKLKELNAAIMSGTVSFSGLMKVTHLNPMFRVLMKRAKGHERYRRRYNRVGAKSAHKR